MDWEMFPPPHSQLREENKAQVSKAILRANEAFAHGASLKPDETFSVWPLPVGAGRGLCL